MYSRASSRQPQTARSLLMTCRYTYLYIYLSISIYVYVHMYIIYI